jgi:methylated-DNA-[protein]-cysteine S-methyltransferase
VTAPHRWVDSPIGPISLRADSSGRVTELCIGVADATSRSGSRSRPAGHARDGGGLAAGRVLDRAVAQLDEYFEGTRRCFDLPVAMVGTAFQHQVWARLQEIPFGATVSYGELAAELGRPGAARAVGHANARNPIPVIVPCHRVIGSSGQLTGYGGGLRAKRLLLDLETGQTPSAPRREGTERIQSSV